MSELWPSHLQQLQRSQSVMARKRQLAPQSVWDEPALRAAFLDAKIKDVHVHTLYK